MKHLTIFYINIETALKTYQTWKKCYKHYFWFLSSWVSKDFSRNTHGISLINLAKTFHWFCATVFVLFSAMKRESSLILRYFRIRYFRRMYVQDYIPDFENEFHENFSRIINFLLWKIAELNWSALIFIILKLCRSVFRTLSNI